MATKKPRRGRPHALTPENQERYLRARRRGGNDTDCANYAGIHRSTVHHWRQRVQIANPVRDPATGEVVTYTDDESDPPILELIHFFDAIEKADADSRLTRLAQIEAAAANGQWQAAAWWLERRFPDEYGRRERRDVTIRDISDEALDEEIRRLEAEAALIADETDEA